MDHTDGERFIEGYKATFESFDLEAITGWFAFPCQVASEGEHVTVVSVPTGDAWRPQIARIIGAYRLLGVVRAEILDLRAVPVTPRVGHAVVTWGLRGADDAAIYDFHASYTLADTGAGLRIIAIAHDETPRLMAAVARAQAG
jgi:hypothetical protein